MARTLLHFLPLLAITAAASVVQTLPVATGIPLSPSLSELGGRGFWLAVVLWVVCDARRRRCVPCYDFGFLVAVFLPFSLIWYALWTRGWKGTILLAALLGLVAVPSVISVLVLLALHAGA